MEFFTTLSPCPDPHLPPNRHDYTPQVANPGSRMTDRAGAYSESFRILHDLDVREGWRTSSAHKSRRAVFPTGRRKISLGRPRPLFRWPMKPMGPIGLTGVNRAKNKRNFGCVWPPVTTKAPRPTRCGSIEQPLGLFRPNVPVLRRIRVFRFVTSPFFS